MFIVFLFLSQIGLSLRMLLIGTSVLVLVQLAFFLRKGHYFISPFPKRLQLLQAYEREKMGKEWKKLNQLNAVTQVLLVVILLVNAYLIDPAQKLDINPLFFAIFVIIFSIFINMFNFFHNRKLDKSDNFKGYTVKTFIISFIFALFTFFIIITSTLLYVFRKTL